MLAPLGLLFVGAVLILNGIWMFGRIDAKEIVLINLVVATVTAGVAIFSATAAIDIVEVKTAALTLLFTTTYLWVAYNRLAGIEGQGLGWFSLFVAVTVTPEAILEISTATSALSLWLGLSWAAWALLWLMYFVLLTLKWPIQKMVAVATFLAGIFTAWLPSMLILYGARI